MKRCPECRRDYYDETLRYCLDDGNALLDGPGSDSAAEARTQVLTLERDAAEQQTKRMVGPSSGTSAVKASKGKKSRGLWILIGGAVLLVTGVAIYWFDHRDTRSIISGNFRDVNSAAYDYYLRGKLDATSQNRERNQNAIRILEEVVSADPGFAPAYAALARAYSIKADLFTGAEQKKLYDDAAFAAEKALAIDPSLAEAHLGRGEAIWNPVNRFPHEQTILAYKKAILLDPKSADAHHLLGLVYYHIGLLDKSESELQRAIDLDPSNPMVRFRIGLVSAYRTNYEEALSVFKTVPREANSAVIDRSMAGVLFQLGRTEESWKIVEDYLASNADEGGNVTSVKAMLLAKAGRGPEAEEAIRRTIEIGQNFQHFHHATYNIASAYALLNNRDQALKWLRFTADEGFPCYPLFEKDQNLDNLRVDPGFISFMAELRQQWERHNATL